jgi:hypothetical protein
MARFKYPNYLSQTKHASFDLPLQPSAFVPCGGIYRCTGCGTEIALEGIGLFPDRSHHKHEPAQGPIQWQLVVATVESHPAPYLHGAA